MGPKVAFSTAEGVRGGAEVLTMAGRDYCGHERMHECQR